MSQGAPPSAASWSRPESVVETKDGQKVQTAAAVAGLRARQHGSHRRRLDAREEHAGRDRLGRRVREARAAFAARGRPHAAARSRSTAPSSSRRRGPSSRSATRSRSRPATWPTSTARSPRSTRTRASSRCSCRSSSDRSLSSSSSTRCRSLKEQRASQRRSVLQRRMVLALGGVAGPPAWRPAKRRDDDVDAPAHRRTLLRPRGVARARRRSRAAAGPRRPSMRPGAGGAHSTGRR